MSNISISPLALKIYIKLYQNSDRTDSFTNRTAFWAPWNDAAAMFDVSVSDLQSVMNELVAIGAAFQDGPNPTTYPKYLLTDCDLRRAVGGMTL